MEYKSHRSWKGIFDVHGNVLRTPSRLIVFIDLLVCIVVLTCAKRILSGNSKQSQTMIMGIFASHNYILTAIEIFRIRNKMSCETKCCWINLKWATKMFLGHYIFFYKYLWIYRSHVNMMCHLILQLTKKAYASRFNVVQSFFGLFLLELHTTSHLIHT